ncbi:uncharacterized protein FOMMEDRAFT_164306 [Fomitiporia mediterranea MF3/22]|uniref:uncharacterized protein n=1 Tax=Fomitiporia mediterranea (strain MF3/22) TaxID=694068 RepID=UPI0004408634|nr:uncharacterized protein FOMMEDRAFT_164306 [Fomitiporia mediterranea MF3/22]EJD07299.1 hypothetical protein FOMMEDRAFT_164306 [Fomitiporia mediterranea MF3/22]
MFVVDESILEKEEKSTSVSSHAGYEHCSHACGIVIIIIKKKECLRSSHVDSKAASAACKLRIHHYSAVNFPVTSFWGVERSNFPYSRISTPTPTAEHIHHCHHPSAGRRDIIVPLPRHMAPDARRVVRLASHISISAMQ